MTLYENKQHYFTVDVLGYQYPDLQEGYLHDRNWLSIQFRYQQGNNRWDLLDPALLTWEASELADYLEFLGEEGKLTLPPPLTTLDQQFSIRCTERTGSHCTLDMTVYAVSPPSWLSVEPNSDVRIQLIVECPQLLRASHELKLQLRPFPQRDEWFS